MYSHIQKINDKQQSHKSADSDTCEWRKIRQFIFNKYSKFCGKQVFREVILNEQIVEVRNSSINLSSNLNRKIVLYCLFPIIYKIPNTFTLGKRIHWNLDGTSVNCNYTFRINLQETSIHSLLICIAYQWNITWLSV